MSSGGGGGGGEGGSSSSSSRPSEDSSSGGPNDSDLRSVDPQGEPFDDPRPPRYEHPSRRVIDHLLNRARGGPATDEENLDPKTWEANSRKAGFEGNYTKDVQRYMDQGLTREQAEYVLQDEKPGIETDMHPSPMDPDLIDELPNQSFEPEPDPDPVCR